MALLLDIESRSRCDLIKHGTYNYAQHPSTEIICVGHKLDTFPSGCVVVDADEKGRTAWGYLPKPVVEYIQNSTGLVYAFNAAFEREVWRACAPEHLQIPDDRWYCMSAQARLNGLPASLANATRAITGRSEKDFRGLTLIRLLCIPRADGSFNKDPALIEELRQYCEQDVEAMDIVRINTRAMTPTEFHDWQVNERINMLGVTIDIGLAELCVQQAGDETEEIANKLKALTDGYVSRHTQISRAKRGCGTACHSLNYGT
jgi:DNA polymerase